MSKRRVVFSIGVSIMLIVVSSLMSACTKQTKPVIVLAAFGSSMESGQANLNDLDAQIRARFADYDVRWAFTAGFIVDKLKSAGIDTLFDSETPIKGLDEVYADLRKEGKTNVVVQCVLVMEGAEMRQVLSYNTEGLNVKYGYPLLFGPENIQNAVNALASQFGDAGTATILCAHGNEAHPQFNASLIQVDEYVRANYENVYLATVEGPPGWDTAIADVKASGAANIHFVPLMLTEGDHITNDVMGDEPESWKVLVGLPATNATGMASNAEIVSLFADSVDNLVNQFD